MIGTGILLAGLAAAPVVVGAIVLIAAELEKADRRRQADGYGGTEPGGARRG